MARYHVEAPHTKGECLSALDEMAKEPATLKRFDWACGEGRHVGYAVLEAEDESRAREMLPPSMRDKARITEVGKVTPAQIRRWHAM